LRPASDRRDMRAQAHTGGVAQAAGGVLVQLWPLEGGQALHLRIEQRLIAEAGSIQGRGPRHALPEGAVGRACRRGEEIGGGACSFPAFGGGAVLTTQPAPRASEGQQRQRLQVCCLTALQSD
jgi:hypothetical protein